jgi:hypothetical protein
MKAPLGVAPVCALETGRTDDDLMTWMNVTLLASLDQLRRVFAVAPNEFGFSK